MQQLRRTLEEHGADPDGLLFLDEHQPDLLPYATLLASRSGNNLLASIKAICRWHGSPLMFVVDGDEADLTKSELLAIRRVLALRGDVPYLGLTRQGRLEVFPVGLDNSELATLQLRLKAKQSTLIPSIANERPGVGKKPQNWIASVILRLLEASIDRLHGQGFGVNDAISLVGRALFTRFLADRDLIPEAVFGGVAPEVVFDDVEGITMLFEWLARTFNGELLPVSDEAWLRVDNQTCFELGNIMRRAVAGQLHLGWEERWDHLDFSHIPVGVLSQAYEHCLKSYAPKRQKEEASYYTPEPIAELMVKTAFAALRRSGKADTARVLDPATGGGIFIIKAFREMVAERWRATGRRPETAELRGILFDRITGFDVNEGALRFAALGLYLSSIELDPSPEPVSKLHFDNLRGRVLHRVSADRDEGEGLNADDWQSQLGSLGPLVGEHHNGVYDLVIGNPPWSKAPSRLKQFSYAHHAVRQVMSERAPSVESAPQIPQRALDQAFLWRAMLWAKPAGQIALVMHARLLYQQDSGTPAARSALFSVLNFKSIISAVELRKTNVWPNISAPFYIAFAANETPNEGDGFRHVVPSFEKSLNNTGIMRIDALTAAMIDASEVCETPEVFKVLLRGSEADLEVLKTLREASFPSLKAQWLRSFATHEAAVKGNGFQTLRPSTLTGKGETLPGQDASELFGLPVLHGDPKGPVLIDAAELPTFDEVRLHRRRDREIYRGPLFLVQQSPHTSTKRLRVALSRNDIAYTESFYGFRLSEYALHAGFGEYLSLILGSKLALWYFLMTSGKFGFERDVVEMKHVEDLPLPDFDALSGDDRSTIRRLFEKVVSRSDDAWQQVDEWVLGLYGIAAADRSTIADTLEFGLPFPETAVRAATPPTAAARQSFCAIVEEQLKPWGDRLGFKLQVNPVSAAPVFPWRSVLIESGVAAQRLQVIDWADVHVAADRMGMTEVVLHVSPGTLAISRFDQARFWTGTRAKALAQSIVWQHLDHLTGGDVA